MKINQATPTSRRYSGTKRCTNLSIDGEIADLVKKFLPMTRYVSLSNFVDASLIKFVKEKSQQMRDMGLAIPPRVFLKD